MSVPIFNRAAHIRMTEIVNTQTPPILHNGPSEKEMKYDRQLRLWAKTGQAALESANILLLNSGCGAVGVETLKNLILPGIGRFTIFDDRTVKESDLGVNFFLDEPCLDKSRAQCCAELLQELNPDVNGDWFPKSANERLDHVLNTSPVFTMILFTFPAKREHVALVENYGRLHRTPIVSIHSAGFYSYFRIDLQGTFPIVDTHPDTTATTDLRILDPWPELENFAMDLTHDMDNLDNHKHGHIPYVAILLHFLEKWRESHGSQNPGSYKEKVEFRKMVESGMRRDNSEGGEENFEEAAGAVLKSLGSKPLPSSLREVFEYQPLDPVSHLSSLDESLLKQELQSEARSRFWLIAAAIKAFYEKHQRLPVPGSVPDMKAQSDVYVRLQRIYKDQAQRDANEVMDIARCTMPGMGEGIDMEEVEMFCKNAAFAKLINSADKDPNLLQKVVESELSMNSEGTLIPIYLALSATCHDAELSAEQILASIKSILPKVPAEQLADVAGEVARAAGGELHNISSLVGGMVAQEMIKIITKQYIPIDNTCIFDGIGSRCQVLRL
ncbi:hypothetical protein MKZ38_004061 [Zalerion maritima]|uniref:NEDD8-activating enzyme E1 regulatory subunit n=1 Tax=Zalerion maritima TaxID=339359 RepID=A0AAD5RM27_9PEZI|nr:hypothetical protein MKZ38_004061 [Zalerion maritima]